MNKHVAKPKQVDSAPTEADVERYLRDHHVEISGKLREGKAAIDRGDVVEVKSLEDLLAGVQRRARRTKQG